MLCALGILSPGLPGWFILTTKPLAEGPGFGCWSGLYGSCGLTKGLREGPVKHELHKLKRAS